MLPVSIVIPTYGREAVLVDTLEALLADAGRGAEIIVVDQSSAHQPETSAFLETQNRDGAIVWMRRQAPSITQAMNAGLTAAARPIVLFLDDDIRPESGLAAAHLRAHQLRPGGLVAGRVIQPWQEGVALGAGFSFAQELPADVDEFMGGNFSIDRKLAISLGGFDENFVRVAYRFEAEFAHRLRASGRKIHFDPSACVHHLKASAGGTRAFGEHLTTWRPDHAVGAYYYALRTHSWSEFLVRPWRSAATRYHLRRPWRIPATLIAELGGLAWALALNFRGPRLLTQGGMDSDS